jgi:hypothetical protein
MDTLTCSKCGLVKGLDCFYKKKVLKRGYTYNCKDCIKTADKNDNKKPCTLNKALMEDILKYAPTFDTFLHIVQDAGRNIDTITEPALMLCSQKYPNDYLRLAKLLMGLNIAEEESDVQNDCPNVQNDCPNVQEEKKSNSVEII